MNSNRHALVAMIAAALFGGCTNEPQPTGLEAPLPGQTLPHFQLTDTRAGTFAYVANVHSGDISVLETTGHTVVATIVVGELGGTPGGVAASPDGAFVYVTDRTGGVWVIETASNTLVRTVRLPNSGGDVGDIAVSPDGRLAYVTGRNAGNVFAIEISTGLVMATIPVGQLPSRVAFSPDGTRAYVVNFLSNNVSVIETATHTIVQQIPVGTFPNDIAISSDGSRAYVANWGSSRISVIDVATGSVVQSISVSGAFTLDLSADDAALFVASWSQAFTGVTRINTATNSIVGSFSVAANQANIELTPDATFAYLTDFSAPTGTGPLGHSVVVVDTRTNSTVAVVEVGEAPFGMAMVVLEPADLEPPVLSLPADFAVDASSPSGAVVSYTVSASDAASIPTVSCTPASGSLFAIGTHTVICTATDASGNSSTGSFLVTVKGAEEQITDLQDAVAGLDLEPGIETSLDQKLAAASSALASGERDDACGSLQALINQVNAQSDKKIEAVDAAVLIAEVERIRTVLGC